MEPQHLDETRVVSWDASQAVLVGVPRATIAKRGNGNKLESAVQQPVTFTVALTPLPSDSCHPARPRNTVWRNSPPRVHSAKDISQTSFGFIHWIFSGIRGGFSNGDLSVKSYRSSVSQAGRRCLCLATMPSMPFDFVRSKSALPSPST